MPLLMLDGFAYRNPTTDNVAYTAGSSVALTTPPFTNSSAVQGVIHWDFGAPEEFEDICCGLRWRNGLNGQPPIVFSNSISGFTCSVLSDGMGRFSISVSLAGTPTTTDASTLNISANEWNFLELSIQTSKIHIPFDPGPPEVPEAYRMLVIYELRVNDEVFLSGSIETAERFLLGSGLDSNPWIGHLNVGAVEINALGLASMTDFYLTASPGDFKGDSSIRTLYPALDVATDFTPSVGTAHYALVNDHPDDTSTYNSATTVGNIDSYGFDSLPTWAGGTQTINGIMALWHLATSDPASGGVFGFYNTPSNFTANFYPLPGGTFEYFYDCEEYTWGSSSVKWTEGGINSLVVGTERIG